MVDLCNAWSVAYAVPVAAFDLAKISGSLEVLRASGDENLHELRQRVWRGLLGAASVITESLLSETHGRNRCAATDIPNFAGQGSLPGRAGAKAARTRRLCGPSVR